jgi:hypothetical protein
MPSLLSSHFLVDFENLARGALPTEARGLLFASCYQAFPQRIIH